MLYKVRDGKHIEMRWYEVAICDAIDFIDENILHNKDTGCFANWIAGIWIDLTFKAEGRNKANEA